jgi:hypothetical protein
VLLARQEVLQNLLALRIADLLQNDLLRSLRADAPELDRLERLLDVIFELDVFALLDRLADADLVFPRRISDSP